MLMARVPSRVGKRLAPVQSQPAVGGALRQSFPRGRLVPLILTANVADLAVIPPAQLADFARLTLHLHEVGFQIGLTFFGFGLLLEGWLVFCAFYFPG